MHSVTVPEARVVSAKAKVRTEISAYERAAVTGCDCLDWRVYGHVCAGLASPSQGESNAWRDIPALRDNSPRPEPQPGDWLPGLSCRRASGVSRSTPVTEIAAA
jgi:hypothetical protein